VGIGIDLGDGDIGLVGEGSSELLPDGSKGLAVSAPGSVELNPNVLLVI